MIRLAEVIDTFLPDLERADGRCLLPGQRHALSAIQRCRTEASGSAVIHCHDCGAHDLVPLACGHRCCPQCQHAAGEWWLERQRAKRLPADYFMITFTLPTPLRALVYDHQRDAYDRLIRLAWETLAGFGQRDRALQGDLGATAVLHTHTRALDFHPHVHVVLPAGAVNTTTRQWRTKGGQFLFPQKAMAKVFRGKWFQAMQERGWSVMATVPKQWVVDCTRVGNGEKALVYLARYLYRGVLSEHNIRRCDDGQVTFRDTDNRGASQTRTLAGADFLWLLLQHVLPKGLRRTRDDGFLHANRKRLIQLLQRLLRVCLPPTKPRPPLCCKHCGGSVTVTIVPFTPPRCSPHPAAAVGLEMPME